MEGNCVRSISPVVLTTCWLLLINHQIGRTNLLVEDTLFQINYIFVLIQSHLIRKESIV